MSRFEIVRTDAGWHARFRAGNKRIVWTTEVYTRWSAASRAVDLLCDAMDSHAAIEVREIDERTEGPPPLDDPRLLGAWALKQRPIRDYIDADKKIHAIRELRMLTGAGLIQAKEGVEFAQSFRGERKRS